MDDAIQSLTSNTWLPNVILIYAEDLYWMEEKVHVSYIYNIMYEGDQENSPRAR